MANQARLTFLRFPETILVAVACAALSIFLVEIDARQDSFRYLAVLTLAIPFLFSATVAAETHATWRRTIRATGWILTTGILLLLSASYSEHHPSLFWFRYWQLSAGAHFLAAFAPFARRGSMQGFWQYNRELFHRFLLAVVYSGTVQIGLSLALFAVDKLLGLDIEAKVYGHQWSIIGFLFNTWIFLGWVPSDWGSMDRDTSYPKELRLFVQYILIPIVTLYFVILYLYIGKVIALRDWPKGTIGYLVSGASILGIFSLMLIHPLRESEGRTWIKTYARSFYIALYPLIVMLVLALLKRTDDYGLTERRYLLFVIAGWLAAMATYFTASRIKNIRVVPISLCILAFATAVGPWSAYSVSARWQRERLSDLLIKAGALVDGRAMPPKEEVPFEVRKEISGVLSYFRRMHGYEAVQPLFSEPLTDKMGPAEIMKKLGMDYVDRWARTSSGAQVSYDVRNESIQDISDYNWMVPFNVWGAGKQTISSEKDGVAFEYDLIKPQNILVVRRAGGPSSELEITPLVSVLQSRYGSNGRSVPAGEMTIFSKDGRVKAVFGTIHASTTAVNGRVRLNSASGTFFIKNR